MKEDFIPFPLFHGRHQQTVLASVMSFEIDNLSSSTRLINLPDGDQLALEVSTPKNWQAKDPTIAMVHGLCGSHRSSNLIRVGRKLYQEGTRVVRINLRGCGTGKGLARHFYHSGSSHDVKFALEILKKESPDSPITLLGYSLGGNIVLKLAGELGKEGKKLLSHVIAISPPADLKASVRLLGQKQNRFYERYFVYLLLTDLRHRHRRFDLDLPDFPLSLSVFEFDEYYIAPTNGYVNAYAYYDACSSKYFVPNIDVPCHILFAEDDPIIDANSLSGIDVPACVDIKKTEKGGHLGFLAHPKKGFRWMDRAVLKWIKDGLTG